MRIFGDDHKIRPRANLLMATQTLAGLTCNLSIVNGAAFVTNPSVSLAPYINRKITITDAANKALVGWIKAAGAGETYSSNLVSGWTNYTAPNEYATLTTSGVDITSAIDDHHAASANMTGDIAAVSEGQLYRCQNAIVVNSGQSPSFGMYVNAGNPSVTFSGADSYRIATGSHNKFFIYNTAAANWSMTGFLLRRVLTPSAGGVRIVDAQGGTTYDWASEASGFDRNAANYTVTITES